MSEEIFDKNGLHVSTFSGGKQRGKCFNFYTPDGENVELTKAETIELIEVLQENL